MKTWDSEILKFRSLIFKADDHCANLFQRSRLCSASLIIHHQAVFVSHWWPAGPAAVSTAGIPVSSQPSVQTEHIPAFTSSPYQIITQWSALCHICALPAAICSCPALQERHGQPLPKHHSGFSSTAMFTRSFQDYFCLTEITLKLHFDLFILYPFKNMATVLLSRGGVSALCQWTCSKKQTLCV